MPSVFIVEDDRKIAKVVKVYLEEAGYRVMHFEKGRDAVDAVMKEKSLLVILAVAYLLRRSGVATRPRREGHSQPHLSKRTESLSCSILLATPVSCWPLS